MMGGRDWRFLGIPGSTIRFQGDKKMQEGRQEVIMMGDSHELQPGSVLSSASGRGTPLGS